MHIYLTEKEFEALHFAISELSGNVESGTCNEYEKRSSCCNRAFAQYTKKVRKSKKVLC